ncbi:MAG: aminoacyl-tRNA hydrolase [Elusimicrobia bacterium]|nr:aminoacyl-tRNA hydrolase [Elusimicrobiota bacterium]
MRLVVGLGNPGPRYARTRHNAGSRVVSALAGEDASWKDFRGLGVYARAGGVLYGRPMTFMNDSGAFVSAFSRFHRVEPAETLVCFDDISLPLGRMRLRPSGSSGGQKGMKSIIDALGTDAVPRLRLGVGPVPAGWDATDFVLGRFSAAEEDAFCEMAERGVEAVRTALDEGLEAAMNKFNREEPKEETA